MRKILPYIFSLSLVFLAFGCIKNDIPYPRIQAGFSSFTVEYQSAPSLIDSASRTVTVYLTEEADIRAVKITGYKLSGDAYLVGKDTILTLDLSQPDTITLGLYQDYDWVITAEQPIDRYFGATGEIGSPVIDVPNNRVVFTFPDNMDITRVYVDSIKLGQTVSVMDPDLNGTYVDFSLGVPVNVTTFGETVTWHIYADISKVTVFTQRADAWTNVAWIYGEAEADKDNGFEYRLATEEEWTKVPQDWITFDGGTMTARLIHLAPETEYAVRAYSDKQYGEVLTFTTQGTAQMSDSSFDNWSLNGKVWQPWGADQTPYWDTGNKGATVFGDGNVMPTTDTSTGTGQAALLKTEWKVIKLAAGSIFAGSYVRTDGTNGVLSFGRTFTQRPTKLRGSYKYHSATINNAGASSGLDYMKGQPDTCIVWIALIDSEEPFEIRTNPSNRHLFNPNGSEVIAYGSLETGYDVEKYTEFEVTLDYRSTSRIPRYILCVASSSKYGDYFTGGTGSELYLDDLELLYDY